MNEQHVPWAQVTHASSKELSRIWKEQGFPPADYCITSPPYWNQLKRNHIRQKNRVERGLDTVYSTDPEEIGNTDDYREFLAGMKLVFDEVHKVMKPNGYLTVITNNVFHDGKMHPLAFDTVSTLSKPPHAWTPKDEKYGAKMTRLFSLSGSSTPGSETGTTSIA